LKKYIVEKITKMKVINPRVRNNQPLISSEFGSRRNLGLKKPMTESVVSIIDGAKAKQPNQSLLL
jgi:hypothetical protein